MSALCFYRDKDGVPCAKGEDARLAAFLESDIQDSLDIAESLLAALQLPEEAEFNGNAFSVNIDIKTVCISNQLDDAAIDRRLSRADFSAALESWYKFIKTAKARKKPN